MSKKGTFDLPMRAEQSTKGARKAYRAMWSREWPHEDEYLRKLAQEVATIRDNSIPKCATLLNAMRECHEFETTN